MVGLTGSESIAESDRDGRSSDGHLKSRVIKRSLVVGTHKTSISLEDRFWKEFRAIAQQRHVPLATLAGQIDSERLHLNLSSAIRVFVFEERKGRMPAPHASS